MKTRIATLLLLSLSLVSIASAKEGGVSSGGGGDDIAHVEVDAISSRTILVCPNKGTFDCDDHCESALDQVSEERMQSILSDICSSK